MASAENSFRIETQAGGDISLPITWGRDSPIENHFGGGAHIALQSKYGFLIPLRIEIGYSSILPSTISSTWELYRGWDRIIIAGLAGVHIPIDQVDFGMLGGAGISIANYRNTPLIFAYPSVLINFIADFTISESAGIFGSLPCEYMLRGYWNTFMVGASFGLRLTLSR